MTATTKDYKQKAEQLEKQVKLLKQIISELTAQDSERLPFTSWPEGE